MEQLNDTDLHDVAYIANLDRGQLRHLFTKLHIEKDVIKEEERKHATSDLQNQAFNVLHSWRKTKGQNSTRTTICEALEECGYSEALELLVRKWDLNFQERSKVSPDRRSELDEKLIQVGLEPDYWVGILKTKLNISLPLQIQYLDETSLKTLNDSVRYEWEKKALRKFIGLKIEALSIQAEQDVEPDVVFRLTEEGLEGEYWADVLRNRLGITQMAQSAGLKIEDFNKLKAAVRYDWEESILRNLFLITNEASEVFTGELQKHYKKKLEETRSLLNDLVKLRKTYRRQEDIHHTDDTMNRMLDQLRELISLTKEEWKEKYENKGLDYMISHISSDLEKICKRDEGRPEHSAAEILKNASAGLALKGILVGEDFPDDCVKRTVLSTPTDVALKSPAMLEVEDVATFSSKAQFDNFQSSLDKMGYIAAATLEGNGWGFKAKVGISEKYEDEKEEEESFHKQPQFESRVMYSVVPIAACELNQLSLKLSPQALLELKTIDRLLVGRANSDFVERKCEEFLITYGSHVNAGILHFGGVAKFVATYTSETESKSDKIKPMVRDALNAYVSSTYSGFGARVDGAVSADQMKTHDGFKEEYEESDLEKTTIHFTKNGGPEGVGALQLWKMGLVTCSSTWALIDRGRSLFTDFVGVWKLITNHKCEFDEPYKLESSMVTVWERMSGYLGPNDQERTFRKGLENLDLLNKKIAKWNSCPKLQVEKCTEYLQEMLETVEEVEAQTKTNKYWVNMLCTDVEISGFLRKVLELKNTFDPKNESMTKLLIRKLVNPVGGREFPGKLMVTKWAAFTKSEEKSSLIARVGVKSIPDLVRYLKAKIIPSLQQEYIKSVEGSLKVCGSINAEATDDLTLCVWQLLKDLQSSEKEHEMFFLKIVLMPLYYHWPTMKFGMLLTMEQLQNFAHSIENLWKEFQVKKGKGKIELESFLINTLMIFGHFEEGGESSEDEFSEIIKEIRRELSPELNTILNRYATKSPFNWSKMKSATNELAKGKTSVSEERKLTIRDLENVTTSQYRNPEEEVSFSRTKSVITAQGAFSDILKTLGLDNYYPSKISRLKAMVIKKETGPLKLVDVPWEIIHKLLMIDFHARDHLLSSVNKSSREERPDDVGDSDFEALLETQNGGDDEDKQININTLDALVVIFTCCDNFLKQTLVQKLFVCKLAIPFLYPLGSEGKVGMSLWALRTVNIQRHSDPKEALETPMTERPFPLVSFVRLGRPPFSKSKLINDILRDDSHDTFFHYDCNNGTVPRRITDGLVECSWFISAGKEREHLSDTTMVLNLRGDAYLMTKQMNILLKISSVLFVIVTAQDLARAPNTQTCKQILQSGGRVILFLIKGENKQSTRDLRTFYEAVGKDILKRVPTISSNKKEGVQKNASELKTEARKKLSEVLAECSGISIEECAQHAMNVGISIDENDDKACVKGRDLAEQAVTHMKDVQIVHCKTLLLPLQGKEWIEYCKLLKRQHRTRGKGLQSSTYKANRIKENMDRLREKQVEICNRPCPFIKGFMSVLHKNRDVVMYFLKWMNILLDEKSRTNLPGLRRQYHNVWTEFQEAKKMQDKEKVQELKSQVDDKENQLSAASLGVENLFRELGQIYEAVKESGEIRDATRVAVEYLPERAAELLLNGIPLELVDGDASSIPIGWVCAVLEKLEKYIGKKKIFVLSVLGIQSSGKSTLLNTMFGLEFAVSAGRCTRGAYMQLIPVDGDTNLPFDYVAVVDTEGLRAPELGQLKYEHDNELATLVIGMGDVTMINIKGENTAEMKDILQIVVHAFLRMNLVKKNIQDNRTCIFVHQNVPAANADELMMNGCQKLQESLDHMAKEAALSESITNIHSFSQIIKFDVHKHVWYFSDLWHGNPPMAPANPGYSEKVRSVRFQLLQEIAKGQKTFLTPSELSVRLCDLWNGVLADDFVFSFRNSLEVKAYNILQSKYYTLLSELQDSLKSWLNNAEIKLKRCESLDELENSYQSLIMKFNKVLTENAEGIKTCLIEYFENGELHEIIIQWQESKLNQLNFAVEQQLYEGRADLLSINEARKVEIMQAEKWSNHEVYIMNKAVELANELKGKEASDAELEQKFEFMWMKMVDELATKIPDRDLRMDVVMDEILHERFHAHGGRLRKELKQRPLNIQLEEASLESSITLDFVKSDDVSVNRSFLKTIGNTVKNFFRADAGEFEARNKTVVLTRAIVKEISTDLKGLSKHDVKFKKSYATEIIQKVVAKIDFHNQNAHSSADCNFTILPQYAVKLAVHVSRHCVQVFTLMQSEYKRKHGVKAKLQKYKNTAWSLFKNKVEQSTEEVLAGDLLSTHLRRFVLEAVKKAIPRNCTDEVLREFQMTKYYMMVKIMDDLAVKESFKDYESYINSSEDFALKWIAEYINEKMFSKHSESGMTRYSEITKVHIRKIMQCIIKSVHHATNEVTGQRYTSMSLWIKQFCQRVSEKLAVPVSSLHLVSVRSVMDFNNLQRIILDQLDNIQADLEKAFANETKYSVVWEGTPPHQQILDKVWGCPEQCPFCYEPCADTTPDHYDLSGRSHFCVQHRPQGIGGMTWVKDGEVDGENVCKDQLIHQTCNYQIQKTGSSFKCTPRTCRISEKCSTTSNDSVYHKYAEYKTYLPDWDIAPDRTNSVSKYWMWFMAKYQHQLKDMHYAKLPEIPKDWTKITKKKALADLRKIHH